MEKGFTYDALVSGTVETYQILESMYDLIDLSEAGRMNAQRNSFRVQCG